MERLCEEVYPFSIDEREYPVYNSKNNRVGNCKKINLCKIEKTGIRLGDTEHQDENKLKRFAKRYMNNSVFLQMLELEECIALRPWNIGHDKNKPKENYIIPEYGSTYFIIPRNDYDVVEERTILNIGNHSSSEGILLKIPADYLEDFSNYKFFELIGEKIKLLK